MSLQLRHLADEGARDALQEAQARIEAVAHVHRRLYTSGDMETVDMQDYLEGLVDELTKSLGPDASSPNITLQAQPCASRPTRRCRWASSSPNWSPTR